MIFFILRRHWVANQQGCLHRRYTAELPLDPRHVFYGQSQKSCGQIRVSEQYTVMLALSTASNMEPKGP
jgi:hypothetical protein